MKKLFYSLKSRSRIAATHSQGGKRGRSVGEASSVPEFDSFSC
jgi:hypothetical protein